MARANQASNPSERKPLTAERAREMLHYDPETGNVTWRLSNGRRAVAGNRAGWLDKSTGYWRVEIDWQRHRLHRVIWLLVKGEWPNSQVDHENGIRSDNHWTNLREATAQQNSHNRKCPKSNKSSGLKGVSLSSNRWDGTRGGKKWKSMIRYNDKSVYLGCFHKKSDAHQAYIDASKELFRQFANVSNKRLGNEQES
jgi:hypothetical protein